MDLLNLKTDIEKEKEGSTDYYDKYLKLVLLNMPVINSDGDNYAVCNCCEFIMDWYKAYTRFVNEEHRKEYTEAWYKANGHDLSPDVDDGFYEVFLETFFWLLEGKYSERQYKLLISYIMYENYLRDFYGFHSEDEEPAIKLLSYEEWCDLYLTPYKEFAKEKLGFEFNDIMLLVTALTHRSYVNEHKASVKVKNVAPK